MTDTVSLILKIFEERNLSVNQAMAILNEVSNKLTTNSIISIKKDK